VGLAIARALLAVFIRLAPTGIPFLREAHLDLRIAVFAMVLSFVCGTVFGLAFALQRPCSATLNARASISRELSVRFYSPQTRRRIRAAQLAKYMAEGLRDLAAAKTPRRFWCWCRKKTVQG
jgi:hypothetical protein